VNPRIPNYNLPRCYKENPELHQVTRLTIPQSIKTLWLTLWDEDGRRLIRFRDLRAIRPQLEDGGEVAPTKPEAVPDVWK
jgi:omega-6 fatty acid desaturase (delta-12 desaturase)